MSRSSTGALPSWRHPLQRIYETLAGPSRPRNEAHRRDLVGIDVTDGRLQARPALFLPLLIAGLLSALFLVGLRNDLMTMRYAIADSLALEEQLRAEKRALTVEMRRLRDPSRLAAHARELGFVRPEQIVDLPTAELRSQESLTAKRSAEARGHESPATKHLPEWRGHESPAAKQPAEQRSSKSKAAKLLAERQP